MRLRVWAPRAQSVEVLLKDGGRVALAAEIERPGWFAAIVPALTHGTDYELVLDNEEPVPDPRARWLRWGVHGPSRVWDPASYEWADADWRGRDLADNAVLYELHVGTFTTPGTFDAAATHLAWLSELGITHVELMPVAGFDGRWGWGYDPVAIDAVHEPYGGPEALCRFVDAAHGSGLAVVLDVVQNHLGPSGAHWQRFGPFLSGEVHRTPWGDAVNLDAPGSDDVREILLSSAIGWLRDFHLDGLRLDAIHTLKDDRALTYLEELGARVDEFSAEAGRPLALIAESDLNDPRFVTPREHGGIGLDAQWDDDIHHGLHWLLTGETAGYYADFGSPQAVAYAIEHGFLHDGHWSSFRGRSHGRPIDFALVHPWRLVVALQTHDQIGNRASGERLAGLVDVDRLAAGAALLLTLPYTPMLFMGEEWGASSPWMYFTAFADAELGDAVSQGRQQEFVGHGWEADAVPDPQVPRTFSASKLDWDEAGSGEHAELATWYRSWLALRVSDPPIGSAAAGPSSRPGEIECDWSRPVEVGERPAWFSIRRGTWRTVVNLSDGEVVIDLPEGRTDVVLDWRERARLEASTLRLEARGTVVLRSL